MKFDFGLSGRNYLVTGANSGIGRAIAIALGEQCGNVAVHYLPRTELAEGTAHTVLGKETAFEVAETIRRSGGKAVPRSELLQLLWPDSTPDSARHRLRQALYQLKKLGAPLTTPSAAVNLRASEVEIDYIAAGRDRQALTTSVS